MEPVRKSEHDPGLYEEYIEKVPSVCGGRACIRNTRIPVWTIIRLIQLGSSPHSILEDYPSLREIDLIAAQEYYELHREEIEQDIREQNEAA